MTRWYQQHTRHDRQVMFEEIAALMRHLPPWHIEYERYGLEQFLEAVQSAQKPFKHGKQMLTM